MRFKSVSRGKMHQVVDARGDPVDVRLYAVRVAKQPYERGGKRYVRLDVSRALGDLDVLGALDAFIARAASPRFSPVSGTDVTAKMARTRYETDDAMPGFAFDPRDGDLVDVVLRPGAYGPFGYCLLVHRIKPHKVREDPS